jgi:hypothetical protein
VNGLGPFWGEKPALDLLGTDKEGEEWLSFMDLEIRDLVSFRIRFVDQVSVVGMDGPKSHRCLGEISPHSGGYEDFFIAIAFKIGTNDSLRSSTKRPLLVAQDGHLSAEPDQLIQAITVQIGSPDHVGGSKLQGGACAQQGDNFRGPALGRCPQPSA